MQSSHKVQTEVGSPDHKGIADQVLRVLVEAKKGGHDQDTVRCALQVFSSAVSSSGQNWQAPSPVNRY
jgi:hypothetical protein